MKILFYMRTIALLGLLLGGVGVKAEDLNSPPADFESSRFAVIDITEVIARSVAWESVQKKFTQIIYSDRAHMAVEEKRLLEEEQSLKDQWESVTQEQNWQKEKEVRVKKILEKKEAHEKALLSLQERVQKRKSQLDDAFNAARSEIHQRIQEIIEEVRSQENLGLVFSSTQLVFFDVKYDITSLVAGRLNATLKTLPFEVDTTDRFWKKPLPL